VDVKTEEILGYVKFYYPVPANIRTIEDPTTAIIYYRKDLEEDLRRFVICKELCHCLIDNSDATRVSNATDLKNLLQGLASGIGKITDEGPMDSEKTAEILALEILCPAELRSVHAPELRAGKISIEQLAKRFLVPVDYLEFGMYDSYLRAILQVRHGQLVPIAPPE